MQGDCVVPGVPGSGAEILMDYAATIGAKTGKLLPTGQTVDTVVLEAGRMFEVSIVDAANPCVFIHVTQLGLTGSELPDAISADRALIETIGEILSKCSTTSAQAGRNWLPTSRKSIPAWRAAPTISCRSRKSLAKVARSSLHFVSAMIGIQTRAPCSQQLLIEIAHLIRTLATVEHRSSRRISDLQGFSVFNLRTAVPVSICVQIHEHPSEPATYRA